MQWTRNLGNIMIKEVEVEIGGQRIDRQFGEWLVIWAELTVPAGQQDGYAEMTGNTMEMWGAKLGSMMECLPAKRLYIPLQFWFNRNYGLALPLIALQYHEVKINLELRPISELLIETDDENDKQSLTQTVNLDSASLWIDYIYLDTDERRRFAQVSHEYLIEQLQFTGEETIVGPNNKVRLNFNHPVKEMIWVARLEDAETNCQWSNFTTGVAIDNDAYMGENPLVDAKLQLNGHDRFRTRQARYFNLVQPYQHHTNIPATGIYVYSFGIKPEEHQPSGTANLSRIDNATFLMTFASNLFSGNEFVGKTVKLLVYAVNYNVLRIMSGINSDFVKSYIFHRSTACPLKSVCY
jgi:Large eukaryotic DNA virus major capsid protein/Major capsid protein N-terminus